MSGFPVWTLPELGEAAIRRALAEAVAGLPHGYLNARRWYGGKGRAIEDVSLETAYALPPYGAARHWYLLAAVRYADGSAHRYALPVALCPETALPGAARGEGDVMFALEHAGSGAEGPADEGPAGGERLLAVDALLDPDFAQSLYALLAGQASLPGSGETGPQGQLRFCHTEVFAPVAAEKNPREGVRVVASEQSNSSVIYGDAFILKLFRRLEHGPNPDLEVLRFLTERSDFRHVPLVAGYAEEETGGAVTALAALQTFMPNEGDAWQYTLYRLHELYGAPDQAPQLLAGLLRDAEQLGRVTGGLHVALAEGAGEDFGPEPITDGDVRRWSERVAREADETLELLAGSEVASGAYDLRRAVLERRAALMDSARGLDALAGDSVKIRFHGDYHLGQVLVRGGDFIILDFEGEPARTLPERRAKHPALRDVAGLLRSLSYAAAASLFALPQERRERARPLAEQWERGASGAFLDAYRAEIAGAAQRIAPSDDAAFAAALRALELEKALYEVRYELRNRPDWLRVPLTGIAELLGSGPDIAGT